MKKANSRSAPEAQGVDYGGLLERWNDAVNEAWVAIDGLLDVQCDFEDLCNSAPQHLEDAFEEVCDLDVLGILLMLQYANVDAESVQHPPATTEATAA